MSSTPSDREKTDSSTLFPSPEDDPLLHGSEGRSDEQGSRSKEAPSGPPSPGRLSSGRPSDDAPPHAVQETITLLYPDHDPQKLADLTRALNDGWRLQSIDLDAVEKQQAQGAARKAVRVTFVLRRSKPTSLFQFS